MLASDAPRTKRDLVGDIAEAWQEVLTNVPAFGSFCEISTKSGTVVTFDYSRWHEEQRRFERERTGRDIILKPRQIGFTTIELVRDFAFARAHQGVQVLVVVQDPEIAEVLFQRAHMIQRGLRKRGLAPKPKFSTRREIVWPDNDSALRIIECGGTEDSAKKKGRSGTIHRLHCTEVAFWGAADATLTALLGSVPDTGEVVIESTANGAGGEFYDRVMTAMGGGGTEKLHFYPWTEHAEYRRDTPEDFDPTPRDKWESQLVARGARPSQIAWWRYRVAEHGGDVERVLQEYPPTIEAAFRGSGEPYVSQQAVDVMAAEQPIELRELRADDGRRLGTLRIYEHCEPGQRYLLAADVAEGTGNDSSAMCIMHLRTSRVVACYDSDEIEPTEFGEAIAVAGLIYGRAMAVPERNKEGATVVAHLIAKGYPVWLDEHKRAGWHTNPTTRPVLFDELRHAIEIGVATTPDAQTIGECRTLVRGPDGKPEARGKSEAKRVKSRKKNQDRPRDDLFVAWAIAYQVRARMPAITEPGRGTGQGSRAPRLMGKAQRARDIF